jgi:hypothetical protein
MSTSSKAHGAMISKGCSGKQKRSNPIRERHPKKNRYLPRIIRAEPGSPVPLQTSIVSVRPG